jgi:hypothetical protein
MKNFHYVGISFDYAPNRLRRYLVFACTGLLLLLFSSCGNAQSGQDTALAAAQRTPTFTGSSVRAQVSATGGANSFAAVSFTASTSYATALRLVTGLGLQLQQPCQVALTDKQGKIIGGLAWSPVGREEYFKVTQSTSTHGTIGKPPTVTVETILPELFVLTTPLAPADWLARLQSSPNVSSTDTHATFNCPNIGGVQPSGSAQVGTGSPTPTAKITSIAPQQVGRYVTVTFTAHNVSYDDALYTVANMGFRLASPCYEQEAGKPADWHPMGQQQAFASTRTLTLATTDMSPTDWSTRIAHTSGVTKVDASYQAHC